jgi:hypothetical protein
VAQAGAHAALIDLVDRRSRCKYNLGEYQQHLVALAAAVVGLPALLSVALKQSDPLRIAPAPAHGRKLL